MGFGSRWNRRWIYFPVASGGFGVGDSGHGTTLKQTEDLTGGSGISSRKPATWKAGITETSRGRRVLEAYRMRRVEATGAWGIAQVPRSWPYMLTLALCCNRCAAAFKAIATLGSSQIPNPILMLGCLVGTLSTVVWRLTSRGWVSEPDERWSLP